MLQNTIKKSYLSSLGYDFIDAAFLPKGKDEYYLRNMQKRSFFPQKLWITLGVKWEKYSEGAKFALLRSN
mgnify:CR=1 FL=1